MKKEIRLTKKTIGSSGGTALLQLIDAFIDKESNRLYIYYFKKQKIPQRLGKLNIFNIICKKISK